MVSLLPQHQLRSLQHNQTAASDTSAVQHKLSASAKISVNSKQGSTQSGSQMK